MEVSIQPIQKEDLGKAIDFWQEVIADTIAKEQIKEQIKESNQLLEEEVGAILSNVNKSLHGHSEAYFLARLDQMIVGSIASGYPNELIRTHLDIDAFPEIKTVYVHPTYQRKGIGQMLFQTILMDLRRCGVEKFCLDCGYKRAQVFWQKLLGPPTLILQNYWGKGSDHMIWLQAVIET